MEKGSSVTDVLIGAAVLIFVIFPVFSVIIEKYIVLAKVQIINDTVDLTNSSMYNALNAKSLGENVINFDDSAIQRIYTRILGENMKLDKNLVPHENSVADGKVIIKSIEIYTDNIPDTCPYGKNVIRPTIHSCIVVPIKPSLYTGSILKIIGKEYFQLEIHVDSNIPVNN
jgi:hypothetical protein